jgi:DNA-binding transcriptional ArsR family regulator
MAFQVPQAVMEVLADEKARDLLRAIAHSEEPIRYSQVREQLGMHPQEFQRALERREDYALVLGRAPRLEGRRMVLLEATTLGRLVADYWERLGPLFERRAQQMGISRGSLAALDRMA